MTAASDNGGIGDPRELLRDAGPERRLDYLVGRASMAPSPFNSQPWRFRSRDGAIVDLQWDSQRKLAATDPEGRLLTIALGAALENFLLAARDLGLDPAVECLPEGATGTTLVRLHMGEPGPLPEPDPRVQLQVERSTGTGNMRGPVEPQISTALEALDLDPVAALSIPEELREALAQTAGDVASDRWGQRAVRSELARWLRTDRRAWEEHRDGLVLSRRRRLPGWLGETVRRLIVRAPRFFDPGKGTVRRIRQAPGLLALHTETDDTDAWLATGRAYQRLGLQLAHVGLDLAPESVLIATPEARQRTAELLGVDHPQFVVRVGRTPPNEATPRRRLHRVLNPAAPTFPLYPRAD